MQKIQEKQYTVPGNILTIDVDWIITREQGLRLIDFCSELFVKQPEVIFIKSHQQAYSYVETNCILYNVDHHHDLGYNDISTKNILEHKMTREGSWVYGAIVYKNLHGYVWVKNHSSDIKPEHIKNEIRDLKIFKTTNSLDDIKNITFDKIIICESADYSASSSFYFDLLYILAKKFKTTIIKDESNNYLEYIKL